MTQVPNSTRAKLLDRLKRPEAPREVVMSNKEARYAPFAMTDSTLR